HGVISTDLISVWFTSSCEARSCSSRGAIWWCVRGGVPALDGTDLLSAGRVDALARILLDRLHLVDDGFLRWVGPALEPGIADLARDGLRGGAQAHHQNIGVVPPAGAARRFRVRAQGRPDARHVVRGDR